MTVGEVGEHALIARIRARIPPPPPFVAIGIGDDAAVVEPERNALEVITTDAQVEGVHFDRTFVGAGDIGHKSLAVNLSDLAAMGAAPRVALLSLILPPAWLVADLDALLDGMLALAGRVPISLIGGNIARSPGPLVVDVTVIGSVHRRRVLTRSGARAGDELYVTGTLGGSAAGLRALRADPLGARPPSAAIERYLRPEPRSRFGLMLGRNQAASACIDLSDGLADGVRQLCDASRVGAVIDAETLPIEEGATVTDAFSGGEDYELLFAVPPRKRSRLRNVQRLVKDLTVTRIGRLTADPAMLFSRGGSTHPLPAGFVHFNE